jgi:fermentation-respiration switch protein FrsA (DUF1100 family)
MKRLILLILIGLTSLHSWGRDIAGDWNGILKAPNIQLRLVLHIKSTEAGYSATMDSPDQGANGIPVTSVSCEDNVLKFAIAALGVEYEGTLGDDGNIAGTFNQMGTSLPLNLVRLVRPQEPAKPYPYYEEEVSFENKDDSVTLAGTLTLPQKNGVFPAVVLISGSGDHNRNEEIMGHKPFLVIADYLTRNGIAVLRFDDRGTAVSTGNFATATTYDFSKDAEAAVRYLQSRKEIHKKKIGLIGHSEGGSVAPMVAARNKDVAFIVLLAGPGVRGDQILLMQQELIAKASGISESDRNLGKKINEAVYQRVLQATDTEQLKTDLTDFLKQAIQDVPDAYKAMYNDNFIAASVKRMTSPWMQYFIKYDPATTLEKVKCPVLAINGEKDLQVPAKVNLETIATALTKGGNKHFTTKEIPGLNHLFQECDTGAPAEYIAIEQTFSPVALDEILRWIKGMRAQATLSF